MYFTSNIYFFLYKKHNILDPSKDFMEQLQQGFNDITPADRFILIFALQLIS